MTEKKNQIEIWEHENKVYLLFYSRTVFSNFYPSKFTVDGLVFNCGEQYFMKKKQELFDPNNTELAEAIMKESSPSVIKSLGRKVGNYDETLWNEMRFNVMCEGVYQKFKQNENLLDTLSDTKDTVLVEASYSDRIWGIGLSPEDAKLVDPKDWPGQNLLGKALMNARERLGREY